MFFGRIKFELGRKSTTSDPRENIDVGTSATVSFFFAPIARLARSLRPIVSVRLIRSAVDATDEKRRGKSLPYTPVSVLSLLNLTRCNY